MGICRLISNTNLSTLLVYERYELMFPDHDTYVCVKGESNQTHKLT